MTQPPAARPASVIIGDDIMEAPAEPIE